MNHQLSRTNHKSMLSPGSITIGWADVSDCTRAAQPRASCAMGGQVL
jgi:hypothetical protein